MYILVRVCHAPFDQQPPQTHFDPHVPFLEHYPYKPIFIGKVVFIFFKFSEVSFPSGSVNLVLKAMGTPDEISSPPG